MILRNFHTVSSEPGFDFNENRVGTRKYEKFREVTYVNLCKTRISALDWALIWVKCDPKYRHFIKSRENSWNHVKIPEIMWNFVNLQEIALAFSSELWFDFNAIGSELGQVSIKNFVKLHEFTKNHGRTGNGGEIMKITGNFGKSRKR